MINHKWWIIDDERSMVNYELWILNYELHIYFWLPYKAKVFEANIGTRFLFIVCGQFAPSTTGTDVFAIHV